MVVRPYEYHSGHSPTPIPIRCHRACRLHSSPDPSSVESGGHDVHSVLLKVGDVLIRHPWALHRGTPNRTEIPRALVTIRYVRRWYADDSREVNAIPNAMWQSFTQEQKAAMRFPVTF